ncbi:MAG: serine/threonine protein kinase, partial [Desulfobacteraceae bacterium]|nr:serine/threonine protein kinase [Desulfobacteraceae bacterium]
PSKDAIHYLIQTCKAVDYAYKQGILHKDINPENLMVIDNKQVKLVDFGLAVFIHEEDDLLDGALPYLAPEIFKGEISDIRSEIYSIGITAFEMVVGKRPFPETDPAVFTKMRDENEIPDPKDFVPDIPDSLQNFIIKACRLDPNKRYSSMEQAIYDLESIK